MQVASKLVVALTIAMIASSVTMAGSGAVPAGAAGAALPSFSDIDCPSATSCFAVGVTVGGGSENFTSLVEHWNGTRWSVMPSPNARNGGALADVTCPTTTNCLAVGASGHGGAENNKAFAIRWNGLEWAIVASPSPAGTLSSGLGSVSCANATTCFAVGNFNTSRGGLSAPLIERWNGTGWAIVKSPKLAQGGVYTLASVSCPSAKRCFAVGGAEYFEFPGAVIASWSGSSWSAADLGVPNFGSFSSVSCVNPSSCFALGREIGGSLDMKTVVERWNGTRWARAPSPNLAQGYENMLDDVTCAGPTNCLAVGRASLAHQGPVYAYAIRWNGKTWSETKSISPHPQNNGLDGVSCASATNCFAVGFSDNSASLSLIERWNGKSWSLSQHPEPKS